jgi:predicted phosphodiesterase
MVTHIGGYSKHYDRSIKEELQKSNCDIFFCGHSHILRVMYDEEMDFLLINPGACGRQGFHQKATLIRLALEDGKAKDLEVMEFDKFGK